MKKNGNLKTVAIALLSLVLVLSVAFAAVAVAEPATSTRQSSVLAVTGDDSGIRIALDVQHLEDLSLADVRLAASQAVEELKSLVIDRLLEAMRSEPAQAARLNAPLKLRAPDDPSDTEEDYKDVLGRYRDKLKDRLNQPGELEKYFAGEYDLAIKQAIGEYMEKHGDEVTDEHIEGVVNDVNDIIEDAIITQSAKEQLANEGLDPEDEELVKQAKDALKEQLESGEVDRSTVLGEKYGDLMDKNDNKREELTDVVKDIVENGAPTLDVADMLSAIRLLKVGGCTLYTEEGGLNFSGLMELAGNLFNRLREVQDTFEITYNVSLKVSFADDPVDFYFTVELVNYDGSYVQAIFDYVRDHVDIDRANGPGTEWSVTLRVPDVHTELLSLVTGQLSTSTQQKLFALTGMTPSEALQFLREEFVNIDGVNGILEELKGINYDRIFARLLDSDWLASHSHGKISAAQAEKYLNALLNRATKVINKVASVQTVQEVEDVMRRFGVKLEEFLFGVIDGETVGIPHEYEHYVQSLLNELHEIGAANWTREDLVDFLTSPDKINHKIVNFIGKVQQGRGPVSVETLQRWSDKLLDYAERALNYLPDRFSDATIANIVTNGNIDWAGTVDFHGGDYDNVLTKAIEKVCNRFGLGTEAKAFAEQFVTWFDNHANFENVPLRFHADFPGLSKVSYTYNVGADDETTQTGVWLDGANVKDIAPSVLGKDGKEILGWFNSNNELVTTISGDVQLHPVTAFEAYIYDVNGIESDSEDNFSKVYDQHAVTLFVTVDEKGEGHGLQGYAYQWYKNEEAIPGATESSYVIPADASENDYRCVVTSVVLNNANIEFNAATQSVNVEITPVQVDLDAKWLFDNKEFDDYSIVFDNEWHTVTLDPESEATLQAAVGASYEVQGDVHQLNVGSYSVEVVSTSSNYVINCDTLEWEITKAEITAELEKSEFEYTGSAITVQLKKAVADQLNKLLGASGWEFGGDTTKIEAGNYTAIVTVHDSSNVTVLNTSLSWKITERVVGPDDPENPLGEKGHVFVVTGPAGQPMRVGGTIIRVVDVNGVVPVTEILSGKATTDDYTIAYFADLLKNNSKNADSAILQVLEVYFTSGIEYEGEFTVKFENSDLYGKLSNEDLVVVHIHNGPQLVAGAANDNGTVTFTVNNFSEFAVLSQAVEEQESNYWWIWVLLAVIIILNIVIILLLLLRRKDNEDDGGDGQGTQPEPQPTEPQTVATVEETVAPAPLEHDEPEEPFILPIVDGQRTVLDRSFTARLSQADEKLKELYNELKNHLLSYKKIRSRVSWKFDSFYKGRAKCVILQIRGKKINMYIALRAEDLAPKYHAKDVSDRAAYQTVPTMVKVSGSRSLLYAKQLVDMLMANMGVERGVTSSENFKTRHRSTSRLVAEDLIKIKHVKASRFLSARTLNAQPAETAAPDAAATTAEQQPAAPADADPNGDSDK